MKARVTLALSVAFVLVLALGLALAQPANAQALRQFFDHVYAEQLTVLTGDADVLVGDLNVATGDLTVAGTSTLDDISQTINAAENIGMLPTVISASMEYTTATLFTVPAGETWIVHSVLVDVGTNFDCTGDNCTLQVGDANDANGLVDLVDAEILAADTEGTGWAAGWQGQLAATKGAYLVDSDFVYAPSASTPITGTVGGTDPAGGAATVYIVYTRIQ